MGRYLTIAVIAVAGTMLSWQSAAAVGCDSCSAGCSYCCPETGTGSYLEIAGYVNDLDDGEEPPLYTRGYYPEAWSTSGRLHFSRDYLSRNRFELRFRDFTDEAGRAWARLSVYPLTIEADSWYYDGYTWDHYQADPALQYQERRYSDVKLRFHDGELDNMLLRYQGGDYQRAPGARLTDYSFDRMMYQYNFDLACGRVRGQFRQVATAIRRPRTGPGDSLADTSLLKLDAEFSEHLSAYGRGSYTYYDYDDLPDEDFNSHKYNVGLRYRPDPEWEFDVSFGARDYPSDNTVTSHVDQSDEYGLAVTYSPCGGSWYEAGYRHRSYDYTQLNIQDPGTRALLRSGSALTPADVADSVTAWSPEQDELYLAGTHRFSDRLTGTGRLTYIDGEMPGSDLVETGSPNLLYDETLNSLGTLTWDVDARNQVAVSGYSQESANSGRDGKFDMQYIEGSWTNCVGNNAFLTLGLRETSLDLDTTFIEEHYTTEDTSYMINFTQDLASFAYALDFTYTDGSGAEEYEQNGAGLDLDLKCLGPVGIRVDWFDRDYAAWPEFDSEALEFGISYRLEF